MRIGREESSRIRLQSLRKHISDAACNMGVEGRICDAKCVSACPDCGSTACQCRCSADCPVAPLLLSSDPENYPIEPAIMPLVFEMKRLGVFRPCWSCEGHQSPDGSVWKIPRVWFYSDSEVHLRLLSDGLKDLRIAKRLNCPWQVAVTFSDPENPETTFSLEPAVAPDPTYALAALRKDAMTIACLLQDILNGKARQLQRTASYALNAAG